MNFSFDSRVFEDVHLRLSELSELLSSGFPQKSKNPLINLLIHEARIQAFLSCHTTFNDFFLSIQDQVANAEHERNFQNTVAPLLGKFYKGGMLTKAQVETFVEQFDSALVLSYDIHWLEKPEQRALFEMRASRIPRYYFTMSTFMSFLAQRVSFNKRVENAPAQ